MSTITDTDLSDEQIDTVLDKYHWYVHDLLMPIIVKRLELPCDKIKTAKQLIQYIKKHVKPKRYDNLKTWNLYIRTILKYVNHPLYRKELAKAIIMTPEHCAYIAKRYREIDLECERRIEEIIGNMFEKD